MSIRDSFVPLIDVGVALGYRTEPVDPANCVALLVEEGATRAAHKAANRICELLGSITISAAPVFSSL